MKNLKKTIISNMIWSIILSIMFPLGIIGIIFGATKSIPVVLILGIIFTVLGFYVMPISWVRFAENKHLYMILSAIENDNIYDVLSLSEQFNEKTEQIANYINTLIQKRYLTGYLFVNKEFLQLNKNRKQVHANKCPNCGGTLPSDAEICDYCGFKIR